MPMNPWSPLIQIKRKLPRCLQSHPHIVIVDRPETISGHCRPSDTHFATARKRRTTSPPMLPPIVYNVPEVPMSRALRLLANAPNGFAWTVVI